MAPRIRSIKPDVWDSPDFMALSCTGQLAFLALITLADDEGRLRTDPDHLCAIALRQCTPAEVASQIERMAELGMVIAYRALGRSYIQLSNWKAHQRVDHPAPSRLPAPDDPEASPALFASPREDSRNLAPDRNGREGKGREGSVPLAVVTARPSGEVEKVFEAWIASTGHHRSVLTDARKRLIRTRLKEYPVEVLLAAVRGWKLSPFHRGENRDRKVWNDLELILSVNAERNNVETFARLELERLERPQVAPEPGSAAALPERDATPEEIARTRDFFRVLRERRGAQEAVSG